MRSLGALAVGLGITIGFACADSTPPTEDLGPPVIHAISITLDSTAKLGHFRAVASDPDGPVALECVGAFSGEETDSLILVRPFAELRFGGDYLTTTCLATEGDTAVSDHVSIHDKYAIDRFAEIDLFAPLSSHRVGEPSEWRVQMSDDWALSEYWFSIAPEPNCTLRWTRVGTWPGSGRIAIDTTVTATFLSPGTHCVVLGVVDDLGRGSSALELVEVAP